ncbi:Arm DNA-binding domain-containing protein [Paracoccus sp. SCSIO 75233]|uniref:Arm DNA-binding domain-containing protein n=1 Tax=Paracoccus sp. SCSIO 75233 TaxID=3017782 RepID=UPI0022F0583D|nr:Arm DNA-binding domain-containing protein [Paracoccus sp. SCSIO 75233]WBU53812.1 Arm DNA-binding domain-containing protein [Paracoccus sp. SCSIO 75233]
MSRQAKPLTARQVRTNPPGRYTDGNGLYLIVDDSGARRWVARVQVRGMVTASGTPKRMEIGLGNTQMLFLDEARAEALKLKKLARAGVNPLQEEIRDI